MRCPVCKNALIETHQLLQELNVSLCSQCQGFWLRYDDYWNWYTGTKSDAGSDDIPDLKVQSSDYLPVLDSKQAKLCPDCGRILIKYRVDARLDFYVDHCGACNGVWLDKNEWEQLGIYNLHNHIHEFFTSPWQKNIHEEIVREHLDKRYLSKFGSADYEKLKKVKLWIDTNTNKNEIMAFLLDKNPFKI